jgi:hypothetical protein
MCQFAAVEDGCGIDADATLIVESPVGSVWVNLCAFHFRVVRLRQGHVDLAMRDDLPTLIG